MTEGERQAAVERAAKRIQAFHDHRLHGQGMFRGTAAGDGLPEPDGAGQVLGVNRTWLRLAREAIARAFGRETRADPSPRGHRCEVYGTGLQRRQGES